MFSGIVFEKRILGHIIISHNVSWLRIEKWVMHVQFEQSRDRVDDILKMRHCGTVKSRMSAFFFFANLAQSNAIQEVNYFIKLRQLFCLKVSCRHWVGEE